jgi:hypothetical protein
MCLRNREPSGKPTRCQRGDLSQRQRRGPVVSSSARNNNQRFERQVSLDEIAGHLFCEKVDNCDIKRAVRNVLQQGVVVSFVNRDLNTRKLSMKLGQVGVECDTFLTEYSDSELTGQQAGEWGELGPGVLNSGDDPARKGQ